MDYFTPPTPTSPIGKYEREALEARAKALLWQRAHHGLLEHEGRELDSIAARIGPLPE